MSDKLNKFLSLFPLEGELTQEILDIANVNNAGNCPGALTLKAALGDNISLIDYPDDVWCKT